MTSVLGLLLYLGVRLGGPAYWRGITHTTLARAYGGSSAAGIMADSLGWVAVVVILAVIGSAVAITMHPALPMKLCACLLASAAVLAPADQARIHVFTSLFKHVGFGAWFAAAVAGYALASLASAVPAVKQRGAARASAGVAIAGLLIGASLAQTHFMSWPKTTEFTARLGTLLPAHKGNVLAADNGNVIEYYLPDELQGMIFYGPWFLRYEDPASGKFLAGRAAYADAIKHGYFSVIALSFGDSRATDQAITGDIHTYGGYQLVAALPYHVGRPRQRVPHLGAGGPGMTATAARPGDGTGIPTWCCRRRPATRRRAPTPGVPCRSSRWPCASARCASSSRRLWIEIREPDPARRVRRLTPCSTAYQAVSLPVNFAGHSFDLAAHRARVGAWRPAATRVDIFLPICGEPMEVLRNTWTGVFELIQAYPGEAHAYVLDDGPSDEARDLAPSFGFAYVRRPNQREHKKAGNLNYAFRRTGGEHMVIFDADFRPRADFLAETLPYLDDPAIGIVQTPQFFRVSPRQTWVERAAGPTLEVFYRAVQVSRDRFGSALCVGSNAVYRRAALAPLGGFTEIPYAEDSHTGLDMRYYGYQLIYMPIPLAAGICPSTLDAFMRQQYRWCCGATSLIWTRHMWRVPDAVDGPAALYRRLAVEPHHRAADPDPAADPDHAAGVPARGDPAPQRPAAAPGGDHRHGAVPAVAQRAVQPPDLAAGASRWAGRRSWRSGITRGGRSCPGSRSRGPGDAIRRFWWGVTVWNGTLAVLWLALAAWRIEQTGSLRFGAVAAFGVLNALIVARLIFPGKKAA